MILLHIPFFMIFVGISDNNQFVIYTTNSRHESLASVVLTRSGAYAHFVKAESNLFMAGTQNQYKLGAMLTYAKIILTNAIGLFLTPLIVHRLGDSEYGLYLLVGSLVSYVSLLDLGLNNTVIRYVSKYRATGDVASEENFLGSILKVYGAISLIVIVVGAGLFPSLEMLFDASLTGDELFKTKIMFAILIFNVAISLPGGTFTAICDAYERFNFPRSLSIVIYILRAITIIAVLKYGGKAIALVVIDTAVNVVKIASSVYFVKRKLKVRFDFSHTDKERLKSIFSYSVWIFVLAIIAQLQWRSGQLILGINTDPAQIAIYGIGVTLGTYFGAFTSAITTLLLPKASKLIANEASSEELNRVMVKIGRLCCVISLMIYSGFIVLGQNFVELWVGEQYRESWYVAALIMSVIFLIMNQGFGRSVLEAKKQVKYIAIVDLITMSAGVVVGFFVSQRYGILAMTISIVTPMLFNVFVKWFYFVRTFGFDVWGFVRQVYLRQIAVIGALGAGFWVLKQHFEVDTWLSLAAWGGVYIVVYFAISYMLLMNAEERALVRGFLRRA